MPPPVFRFAPSPNGYLHLGHAFSAMLNFDLARQSRRRLPAAHRGYRSHRCRAEFEAAIDEDLGWLGLSWERPVRRQSEHFADYRAALEKLTTLGADLSRVRKPRRDCPSDRRAEARERRGRAIPTARRFIPARRARFVRRSGRGCLQSGAPYALRLDMAAACARVGKLNWSRARRRSRKAKAGRSPPGSRRLGRRHHRAQGNADQLSPRGGRRRRPARRHGGGAGPGPVLVDERASVVAGTSRAAATGLSASPPHSRCRRAETLEIDGRHRLARIKGGGRHPGGDSPSGRSCLR